VLEYAAFVRVGQVAKDGMLHAREVEWLVGDRVRDMREVAKVGDKLPLLYVLTVDLERDRFTLTTRPPYKAAPSDAMSLATANDVRLRVERHSKLPVTTEAMKCSMASKIDLFPALPTVAKRADVARETGEEVRQVSSGEEVREVRVPPMAVSIVKGLETVPASAQPPPLRVIARVNIHGSTHCLYEMPWKYA